MTEKFPGKISQKEGFNHERDISNNDKQRILRNVGKIHKRTRGINTEQGWEIFAQNAMFAKILFPEERKLEFSRQDYKALNVLSTKLLQEQKISKHLNISVAQKILFPKQWSLRNKDFHSDEIIWQELKQNLTKLQPFDTWDDIYHFFYFAQNMKILAPKRFETVNLQKMLGRTFWQENVIDELKINQQEHYVNFAHLATPLHILEFPASIEIEPHEWQEMEEQAQELKNYDMLLFSEFSSRRKILAADEIEITNERFDLIF